MRIETLVGATLEELQEFRRKLELDEANGELLKHFGDVLQVTQPYPLEAATEEVAKLDATSEPKVRKPRKKKVSELDAVLAQIAIMQANLNPSEETKAES